MRLCGFAGLDRRAGGWIGIWNGNGHACTHIESGVGRAAPQAGFADPAVGAQAAFRVALEALAHPGRVLEIEADCGVPAGMSPAMVALLLTLVDVDTPLWLPAGVDDEVRAFLRFHCGCSMVDQPGEARFAALPRGHRAPALSLFNPGILRIRISRPRC